MKPHRPLIAILLLALGIRLGIGVFLGFNSGPDQAACGADTVEFEHMAWSAAQGNGFTLYEGGPQTAFRAPGYPMLLAALYRIVGRTYWVNRVLLSLLGVGTCWLVYLLAMRLGKERDSGRLSQDNGEKRGRKSGAANLGTATNGEGRADARSTGDGSIGVLSGRGQSVALLAALITAVLPLQFYWCGHFMSEPVAAFLNVATCLLLVRRPRPPILLAAGVVCGLSVLVRPASLLMLPALGGLWFFSRRVSLKKAVIWLALFAAGMTMVIAPWSIRNVRVLDRFALVATNGGSTFWGANNDLVAKPGEHWGTWLSTTTVGKARKQKEVWPLTNEVDQDRKEWEIGKAWVRSNLAKMPVLLAGKFKNLVKPFPDSRNRIYVLATGVGWLFLFPSSLLGLVFVLRDPPRRQRLIPLTAQLLVLFATTAIFYGSERFRAPYEPFLAIYAAFGILWVWGKLDGLRGGKA